MLTLTGNNTYTGPTSIMDGVLVVSSDANLGLGKTIDFGGGVLRAAGNITSAKGFDPASNGGIIDTPGVQRSICRHRVCNLTKVGSGTLTLGHAMTGSLGIAQGNVVLLNGDPTGAVTFGGTSMLQVAGTIGKLSMEGGTLDIGGTVAATLDNRSNRVSQLLIHASRFRIGSAQSDFWSITQPVLFPFSFGRPSFQFEFQNLGGLTTESIIH